MLKRIGSFLAFVELSVPIDATFRAFLVDLVGAENIYTYGQYLESKQ